MVPAHGRAGTVSGLFDSGNAAPATAAKARAGTPASARPATQEINMLKVADTADPGNQFHSASPEGKCARWLDQQIADAKGKVTCGIVEITPAMARVLLSRNPANRRVSGATVEKIARDIENGTFVLNGESIIVASDGTLNDGQHRLCACVEAGKSIMSVIVFGPARDTRTTVDQGRTKMVGDYLAMEGHRDSLALAAAAGYIWQWQKLGRLSGQTIERPNKGEVLAIVENHPSIAKSVAAVGGNGVAGRGLLAFCHWAFALTSSQQAADEFMTSLVSGANLLSRDPILYARNRLMADRRMSPNEKAKLIFRAWNAHRRGEQPKTLTVNDRTEALPVLES
jgi:hypothetical protein